MRREPGGARRDASYHCELRLDGKIVAEADVAYLAGIKWFVDKFAWKLGSLNYGFQDKGELVIEAVQYPLDLREDMPS